eukprot:5787864-Ditylum_brightwellii.AAC.2
MRIHPPLLEVPAQANGQTSTDTISIATTTSQFNGGGTYTTISENIIKEMNKKFKTEICKLKEMQEMKL